MTKVLATAFVLAALLAGAGHAADEQALTYLFVPFDQFDPQRVSDGEDIAGQNLLEGVVTPNAAGTGVVPATADRWTVSKDGTVYTFHIRSTAKWSDGTPVTAQDFAWSYRRLLTPSTSATDRLDGASSYQNGLGIKNAVAFQLGKVTHWSRVGVKALDPSHLRIVLAAPNASFLQGMTHPSMVPLPRENLTRFPYSWQTAEHWVGNGPFTIESWTPNTSMVLVPNSDYWDRGNVHLDRLTISMGSPSDDEIRARYEQGDLDIARVGDPSGFAPDTLMRVKGYSVRFLTLMESRSPVLRDLRVRRAIALGISRDEVAKAGPDGEPATSLVPRTVPGFDGSVQLREDVAEARRLLAAAGYPNGKRFPALSIMTSHDDPLVRAVVRTLHRNLGITVAQDVEAPAIRTAREREVQPASFVGYFSTGYTNILTWRNWVSTSYPPSQTELLSLTPHDYTHYQVLQAKGTDKALAAGAAFLETHASPQARRFAAVAARADATANPARATALYKQAAAIRQSTYEFIPYAYIGLTHVVRPTITGVHFWTGYFTISFKGVGVRH